ncbi:MAG: glycosyltransferase family 2 protein, partial [Clostridia bacterium]|nr:glycosyltransferase family 2 protein [Clostridia bacterium]
MQPLISVIIPVYKVEDYLPACVESVLSQTYSNTEIILVDDGSPDNCPRMCTAFAESDSRIRVIHKENGGLSSARNAGIDAARGEFLAFLDSDDLWSPWFLERLYRAITETNADFAVCLFRRFQGKPDVVPALPADHLCFSQRDAYECLFDHHNVNMVVAWNKLYRARLFDKIRYPVGKLHED